MRRGAVPLVLVGAVAAGGMLCGGCGGADNMVDQPRYEPLEATTFFENGTSVRLLVPGTVSRDGVMTGDPEEVRVPGRRPAVTAALLERGRQRFDVFCSPCHGRDGYGQGMVVQRGYPAPPSYHTDRLRSAPDEHLYRVITQGLGKMPPHRGLVPVHDRWAITAYVRALQLSQHARPGDVPADGRQALTDGSEGGAVPAGAEESDEH